MKKTSLLLSLLFMIALSSLAQKYRTVELKPITKQGWKYFYDLNKVSSPLALEVPLLAVNDKEVNRHLKASRTWRTAESVVVLIPFVYLISVPKQGYVNQETFWWVFGGTIALQLGFEALSHAQLGLAIDEYNMIILQPTGSANSAGLSLTWKFR